MESNVQKNNLFKALGDFIEAMRKYIAAFLLPSAPGGKWAGLYRDSLSAVQQGHWDAAVAQGAQPETLIDFNNLKGFALKYKHLLKADFGNDVNNLPTWFYEIYDVRNKCNHYQELEDLDYQLSLIHI